MTTRLRHVVCRCGKPFTTPVRCGQPRVFCDTCRAPKPITPPHENRDGGRCSGIGRGGHALGFWSKVEKEPVFAPGACWLWRGYLSADGGGKFCTTRRTWRASRYAWVQVRGSEPTQPLFGLCGQPACMNPDHRIELDRTKTTATILALGRPVERADTRGEMSGRAILAEEQVKLVKLQHRVRGSIPLLARLWNVTEQSLYNVVHGKTWRHIRGRANLTELLTARQLRALVEQHEARPASIDELAASRPGACA